MQDLLEQRARATLGSPLAINDLFLLAFLAGDPLPGFEPLDALDPLARELLLAKLFELPRYDEDLPSPPPDVIAAAGQAYDRAHPARRAVLMLWRLIY